MNCLKCAALVFLFSAIAGAENASLITVGKARFTVLDRECIRLEYNEKSKFIDEPSLFAVNRTPQFSDFKLVQTSSQTIIDTGKIRLVYSPDGHPFSDSNLRAIVHQSGRSDIAWSPAMKNKYNLGGTRNSLDNINGERPVNDGLLARDGWFLLDDSNRFIISNNWIANRPKDAGSDWYFFGYGLDYKGALKALTTVGGPVPMPRRNVLGSWYSRWWPYTSNDYRQIVREYHDHDFPLDNLVMDMDWHKTDTWTGYTWNSKLFPDPENYLKWVHEQHLFATLNDHPQNGIGKYEEKYPDFMVAMGKDPKTGEVLGYNSGDQKYLSNVFKFMHEPLEKMGVDFWWLDWMGDDKYPFNRIDWVNQFYYEHSKHDGLRGQQFSRWADWGDHRHPIHFSGDTHISWPMLAFEIPFTAKSGNAGAFFWSHDMGGFEGFRNGELLTRWVQFGAFSAALRLHSTNKWYLDKRPWTYGKKEEDSMRVAFHLRSLFFPYTYSHVWEAAHDSIPLVRPLYLEYPSLEDSYRNPQEYLYGPDILVAPIISPTRGFQKVASQNVWFPPGIWYDWFTGRSFKGGTTKSFDHDLTTFPLFIRGGVPLTLQPYSERMTTDQNRTLVIRIYPGEEGILGKSTFYEDDGFTEAYQRNEQGLTYFSYLKRSGRSEINVSSTGGSFMGQLNQRNYIFELVGAGAKDKVLVDGTEVETQFDGLQNLLRVTIPPRDIRKPLKVTY